MPVSTPASIVVAASLLLAASASSAALSWADSSRIAIEVRFAQIDRKIAAASPYATDPRGTDEAGGATRHDPADPLPTGASTLQWSEAFATDCIHVGDVALASPMAPPTL